eukprot:gene13228-17728_t
MKRSTGSIQQDVIDLTADDENNFIFKSNYNNLTADDENNFIFKSSYNNITDNGIVKSTTLKEFHQSSNGQYSDDKQKSKRIKKPQPSVLVNDQTSSHRFRLVTYNIDGLNPVNLQQRTLEQLGLLLSENPDIIHLQEVVISTVLTIKNCLNQCGFDVYGLPTIFKNDRNNNNEEEDNSCNPYFTLTAVKRTFSSIVFEERLPFLGLATTNMGRDILSIRIIVTPQLHTTTSSTTSITTTNLNNNTNNEIYEILSLNCHLESCGTAMKSMGSSIRQEQLFQVLSIIQSHHNIAFVAGDLNIRDKEVDAVFKRINLIMNENDSNHNIIDDISDLLEEKSKKSPTWFMPSLPKVSARYDRVYANRKNNIKSLFYKTFGHEEMSMIDLDDVYNQPAPYKTPSDHRGICVEFSFN